jgi:hypothetical protein
MILDLANAPSHQDLLERRDRLDWLRKKWRLNNQCAVCRGPVDKRHRAGIDAQTAEMFYLRAGDLVCSDCDDALWGRAA